MVFLAVILAEKTCEPEARISVDQRFHPQRHESTMRTDCPTDSEKVRAPPGYAVFLRIAGPVDAFAHTASAEIAEFPVVKSAEMLGTEKRREM